jgi:serine/threonine-protein kinase SRK2
MGACCSAPIADPQSAPSSGEQLSSKKQPTKAKSRKRPPSFEYQPLPDDGPKVYRDLLTWEVLPDLGTHGVLDVQYLLGSGGSGSTYLCRDVITGELVAAKFIPRPISKACIPLMLQEVELQTKLGEGHVGIVSAKELILTKTHLALVMDYAPGMKRPML